MLNVYEAAFDRAFSKAIQSVGIDALKRTSMFGSTHKEENKLSNEDPIIMDELDKAA